MAAQDTVTFAIDLNAQGAKAGADAAAGSLETLQAQIDEDTAALGNMNKALKALQGSTAVDIQAFRSMQKQIAAKKATIAQTTESYVKMGGTFRRVKKPADEAGGAFKGLGDKMKAGGGPLGNFAGKLGGLRSMLVAGGMIGATVALVAALAALAAGLAYVTISLIKYGLAASGARRAELLQLEGLTKIRNWYGLAAGKASDLQASIDKVSDSSALGREQINGLAQGLYKAGLRGKAFTDGLEGLAIVTSAAGDEQAAFYKQMILGAGRAHGSIKKVTDDIKARFGEIAARQALGLDVQLKKLRENFSRLVDGLKLEPLLKGLKSVTELFSQSTASGRALKQIFEVMFQPFIDGMAEAGPIGRRFIQGMILAVQRLVIEFLILKIRIKKAFKDAKIDIDGGTLAITAGRLAVALLVGGLVMAAVAAGILGIALAAIAAPFVLGAMLALAALDMVYEAVTSFKEDLENGNWAEVGLALIKGFAVGITGGVGFVVEAIKHMIGLAIKTAKAALDSHSPSRVGAKLGLTLPQGHAQGVDQGRPLVAMASKRMAKTAADHMKPLERPKFALDVKASAKAPDVKRSTAFDAPGRPPPGAAPSSARSTSVTWTGDIHVHTQATDGKGVAADIRQPVIALLREVALGIGAPANG
jgi:hypothetical protein